jgi:hypothetical protein
MPSLYIVGMQFDNHSRRVHLAGHCKRGLCCTKQAMSRCSIAVRRCALLVWLLVTSEGQKNFCSSDIFFQDEIKCHKDTTA